MHSIKNTHIACLTSLTQDHAFKSFYAMGSNELLWLMLMVFEIDEMDSLYKRGVPYIFYDL